MTILKFLLPGVLFIASLSAVADTGTDVFHAMDVVTPKVRQQAPDFFLFSNEGDKVSLSDYAGKVVLLNFWATWCGPCRKEMPSMQRIWERYRQQGFVILAVTADKKDSRQIRDFVKKHNLSFRVLFDPEGKARIRYEVTGLPMSYLVGRDGRIAGRSLGLREWDSKEADELISFLLSQNQ